MFDPLGSSPFADDLQNPSTPPWPTTPRPPNSPIPNLRRSLTPRPITPNQPDSGGIFGKEPRIYGQPDNGLISPERNVGTNGQKYELGQPYLRTRITALDRNRRDILIRFDAQTNLANFNGSSYRNISRSYVEFQQFYDSIVYSNPQTIVPALPLPQTSAPIDEEDDRLVRIMLQRWLTRVCEDPFLMKDEEVRSFIENDFGYQPTPRTKRKTGTGLGLLRKTVPDEDEELQRARFELTKLEGQFFDAAKAIDKVAKARKVLSSAHAEMGNKLINVASTEAHPALSNAIRKIGRTWHTLSDLDLARAVSECVIIGDTLGYQGLNARSAKETLLQRTSVLEEYQGAVKATISKRRYIERLKASSSIRADKVDEAIEDMEEANKFEQILAHRVDGISQNLHRAIERHNKVVHEDITAALVEHVRSTLMYEKQHLKELEALRPDVSGAADKVLPAAAVPRPKVIPPLEDFNKPLSVSVSGPIPPSASFKPTHPHPSNFHPSLSQNVAIRQSIDRPSPIIGPPPPSGRGRAGGGIISAPLAPESPGAGPSNPPTPSISKTMNSNQPTLGGRLVDGTKSMFITPSSTLSRTSTPTTPSSIVPIPPTPPARDIPGPLGASSGKNGGSGNSNQNFENVDPLSRPASAFASTSVATSPLGPLSPQPEATSVYLRQNQEGIDPLGHSRPNFMSQSMKVQRTRPRLDAREAASKLANF